MTVYVNKDHQRRIWPRVKDAMGRTLDLAPGQEVDLDVDVDDPHLVRKHVKRETVTEKRKREAAEAAVSDGDDDEQEAQP